MTEVLLASPFAMAVGDRRVNQRVVDGEGQPHVVSYVVTRRVTEAEWRRHWPNMEPWRADFSASRAAGFYAVLMD